MALRVGGVGAESPAPTVGLSPRLLDVSACLLHSPSQIFCDGCTVLNLGLCPIESQWFLVAA